jgi:hypothetical protein
MDWLRLGGVLVLLSLVTSVLASPILNSLYPSPVNYTPPWNPPQCSSLPWIRVNETHFQQVGGGYVTFHGMNYMGLELHHIFYSPSPLDFQDMESWGFNLVRLPLDWSYLEPEPGVFNSSYVSLIREVVGMANSHCLYVVLDMHQFHWSPVFYAWGGDNGVDGDGAPAWAVPYRNQTLQALNLDQEYFWTNSTVEAQFALAWKYLASNFANDSGVFGYDLFNEPTTPQGWNDSHMFQRLDSLYQEVIDAVREVDQRHIIFLESTFYDSATDLYLMAKPLDPSGQIALEVHDYSANYHFPEGPLSPSPNLEAAIQTSQGWGVPLWVGEFGNNNTPYFDRIAVEAFDSYGLSWTYWAFYWGWAGFAFDSYGDLNPVVPQALLEPYFRLSSSPLLSTLEINESVGRSWRIQVDARFAGNGWALLFVPYGLSPSSGVYNPESRTLNLSVQGGEVRVYLYPRNYTPPQGAAPPFGRTVDVSFTAALAAAVIWAAIRGRVSGSTGIAQGGDRGRVRLSRYHGTPELVCNHLQSGTNSVTPSVPS